MKAESLWGEFLDTEWYYAECREPEGWTLDPWRATFDAFMLPRHVIAAVAQSPRMQFCLLHDQGKVDEIRASIATDGLRLPLEMVYDDDGRMVLRDGHHRLVATEPWSHFDRLPCTFTPSANGIRSNGSGRLVDYLELMLRAQQ